MRILGARIFLSLLAGKLNLVEPTLTRKQLSRKKVAENTGLQNLFSTLVMCFLQNFDFLDNL